jgi:hypothetical protein
MGAGQAQVFAQIVDQCGARFDRAWLDDTVDPDLDRDK